MTVNLETKVFTAGPRIVVDFGDEIDCDTIGIEDRIRVIYKSRLLGLSNVVDGTLPKGGETVTLKFNNKQRRQILRFKPDLKEV